MKKAFTLNELLIALVIIGIIVVIAIPRVASSMDKKSKVAALQSNYTAITNAVKLLMVDERAKSISSTTLHKGDKDVADTAGAFVRKYFKIVKDCGTEMGECFADSYVTINKEAVKLMAKNTAYCAVISTGASICVMPQAEHFAEVLIDLNGPAKPNIAGRDLFLIYIYNDGFVGDRVTDKEITTCKANSYGSGCFNRIMNSGWVMDY